MQGEQGDCSHGKCCDGTGPGYRTPLEAMQAPREKIVYVPCIQLQQGKKDYLATVCVDPNSPQYCLVVHRLPMLHDNDELHHSGWNTCSSCYGNPNAVRNKMILPSLGSSRIYIIDTSNQLAPRHHAVIEPEEMHRLGYSRPHTAHCTASGDVIISTMGDNLDKAKGGFLLIDGQHFKLKGTWNQKDDQPFGYDFWYQYKFKTLISSGWGSPSAWWKGFDLSQVPTEYGNELFVWDFEKREFQYSINLGPEGLLPLEIRFLHNPEKAEGYVGCALSSSVFHIRINQSTGRWEAEKVITVNPKIVEGWALPSMPGLITDILISMDDKFLYFSNWLHGDIRQYDITDTRNPRLVGQVLVGGSCVQGGPVRIVNDLDLDVQPAVVRVKGRQLYGGPQMIQLSLDGKRLYVTDSLLTPWDHQFYPDLVNHGGTMIQVDVDAELGGLRLNDNFLVDFGAEPEGPVMVHEVRYPGGDCSSDIYLPRVSLYTC